MYFFGPALFLVAASVPDAYYGNSYMYVNRFMKRDTGGRARVDERIPG
jgi:hypothetical protein